MCVYYGVHCDVLLVTVTNISETPEIFQGFIKGTSLLHVT